MDDILSYGLLGLSTLMFGLMFFFTDSFRKNYGSGLRSTLVMNLGGSIFGFLVLLLIKVAPVGFGPVLGEIAEGFTPFTVFMSFISIINGLLFSFCSLKALGKINLSLYSLFSMLGGMTLPFVAGILFFEEAFTLAKLACFILITLSLCLTAQREDGSSGTLYYIGVFFFNGMSGVIAKLYQVAPYEKMDSAGFSIFKCLVSILLSFVILLLIKREKRKLNLKCVVAMMGSGTLSHVANWLVLVALYTLPASAQYPFITGGTMIVSTVISLFLPLKPSKKELLAVVLSFVGILLLILLPELELFTLRFTSI